MDSSIFITVIPLPPLHRLREAVPHPGLGPEQVVADAVAEFVDMASNVYGIAKQSGHPFCVEVIRVNCGNDLSLDLQEEMTIGFWMNVSEFPAGLYRVPFQRGL